MKFVIQYHRHDNSHYDLMMETEGHEDLFTLKINSDDMETFLNNNSINAERLTDHRKEYLSYEGQVSRGRGSVKIFDSGNYSTVLQKEDMSELMFLGKKITGKVVLKKIDNLRFSVQYFPIV